MESIKIQVHNFTNNKNQLEKRDKSSKDFIYKTFYLANVYRESAQKLKIQSDSNTNPSPIAMIYAFSCELFLKALIKHCNKNAKAHGHELKKLFEKIDDDTIKNSIRNEYNERFENHEQRIDSFQKLFPVGFEDTLSCFNTAFEYLRYENEYVELWRDSTFLQWFSDTLHMACTQSISVM